MVPVDDSGHNPGPDRRPGPIALRDGPWRQCLPTLAGGPWPWWAAQGGLLGSMIGGVTGALLLATGTRYGGVVVLALIEEAAGLSSSPRIRPITHGALVNHDALQDLAAGYANFVYSTSPLAGSGIGVKGLARR